MRRSATTTALALAAAALAVAPAAAADFYAFGDSLTDCCVRGPFTQDETPTWADILPPMIGLDYAASTETNFAVGGAQSGKINALPYIEEDLNYETGFLSQVERFKELGVDVSDEDVAGIWIGTNDIWPSVLESELNRQGKQIHRPIGKRPETSALAEKVAANVRQGIDELQEAGFTKFIVLSPYDLADAAVTPDEDDQLAHDYSVAVTEALRDLDVEGARIAFVDVFEIMERIKENPGEHGFEHIDARQHCDAAGCDDLPLEEQNSYVFVDGIHLTNSVNELIAEAAAEAFKSSGG